MLLDVVQVGEQIAKGLDIRGGIVHRISCILACWVSAGRAVKVKKKEGRGRRCGEEVWGGGLGRRWGKEVWGGGGGRRYGEEVGEGGMGRRWGKEVWRGGGGRRCGKEVWGGGGGRRCGEEGIGRTYKEVIVSWCRSYT